MQIGEHFFTSAADDDFQSLYERYGDPFYEIVEAAITRLRVHPLSAPVFDGPVRRLVLRGTPLGLFYGVHGTRLAIVAILDLRQDPDTIARRISRGIR